MNSKLLIFVFVVIGFGSIHSSIVKIDGFNNLNIANNQQDGPDRENPFKNVKELTFNISKTVKAGDRIYSEIICSNTSPVYNMCSIGNGKYQARFVKCTNLNYGTGKQSQFLCKHSGHRVTNKNLMQKYQAISCNQKMNSTETAKGNCVYQYSYSKLPGFTEDDDVKNE